MSYPSTLTRYDDIARWLRPQLGTGSYAIVAESFSGPLAVRLAAAHPAGLKALILVASFSRAPHRLPAFLASALYLLPLRSLVFIRLTQRLLVGKWGPKTFPEDFVKVLQAVPRRTLVGRLRAVARVDVSGELTEIRVPKLMITASADALVPRSCSARFAAAGWMLASVEGPHFLALTRAEDVADRIERFLVGLQVSDNRP